MRKESSEEKYNFDYLEQGAMKGRGQKLSISYPSSLSPSPSPSLSSFCFE
jgi:hypothetical protein